MHTKFYRILYMKILSSGKPILQTITDDDLRAIETLDQIIDREGIDLSSGDQTKNILGMYHAGLSIIEISKVLKMGVSEVKYVIDTNNR